MAQDQDLEFLRAAVGAPTSQQPREPTHDEGQEKEHRGIVEEGLVPARIRVSDLYGTLRPDRRKSLGSRRSFRMQSLLCWLNAHRAARPLVMPIVSASRRSLRS